MAGGRRSFSDIGVFKDIHVPILVFQVNALYRIYKDYHVTKVDFLVLAAGYTIQKNSLTQHFNNPELISMIPGVGRNIFFKSLRRLLRNGLIALKEKRRNKRRFYITEQGFSVIGSFTNNFNRSTGEYKWHKSPEFLKIG